MGELWEGFVWFLVVGFGKVGDGGGEWMECVFGGWRVDEVEGGEVFGVGMDVGG